MPGLAGHKTPGPSRRPTAAPLSLPAFLLLLLWPALLGFGPPALTESDDVRLPIGSGQLQQLGAARPPTTTAKGSLIMDLASGRVVFQRNAHARLGPASLTKIMTAVIALEQANLQDKVTILREDLVEGSTMGVQAGDTVSMEQLLWGLLLPSGNDAAEAIARTVGGGSVPRFVDMMNQKAQALRLLDTRFVNPHGLDDPVHLSSAHDLAVLSRYALRNPLFSRMVSTQEYTVQSNRSWTIRNTNQLLFPPNQALGVNGVKTGFTDLAGDSLVASLERDGHQVLVVVLGSENRAVAATALMSYAFNAFTWVSLPTPLLAGARAAMTPAVPATVMVPLWQRYYVNYSVDLGEAAGSNALALPAGLLTYYVGAQEQGRLPLYSQRR